MSQRRLGQSGEIWQTIQFLIKSMLIEIPEKGAEGSVLDKQNYEVADNEEIEAISKDLIEQNLEAYKKLAIRNYWLKNHIENY